MIQFDRFILDNGMRVLVHPDTATPMVVVNVMYDVGARDENPGKTGFAHLFEHLMFGGSVNIPSYDDPLQLAGGENNAYTTNDLTNYYAQLPKENIETAFWLESDRMLNLAFSRKSLNVQRKVVMEEFKEHYINKPYGDVWFKMRELAYTTHPYRWQTIGKDLSHIENATIADVKKFFSKHYCPVNAILVVAGNTNTEEVKRLAEKWFGPIPAGKKYNREIPAEPPQTAARKASVTADVPIDALYKCWHMAARLDDGYYAAELITDILGGGGSSRLYQALVKEKQLFSQIDCYQYGSTDPGLFVIEGKLVRGVDMETADKAVEEETGRLMTTLIEEKELQKVKNKTEAALSFEDMSVMSRAANLASYELLGNANLINEELSKYHSISRQELCDHAAKIFNPDNCSTLYYRAAQSA
jgi:zinc protease